MRNAEIRAGGEEYTLDTITIYDRETYRVILTRIIATFND
jgi:hypothetical protein